MKYFFAVALTAVTFFIGLFVGIMYEEKNDMISFPSESVSQEEDSAIDIAEENTSSTTGQTSTTSRGPVTYINAASGWSFVYDPENWSVIESTDGSEATLSSKETTTQYNGNAMTTIVFSTVKKDNFESMGTKVGDIRYDAELNALIDTSGAEVRCLPIHSLIGKNANIYTFQYGGSLMADPAYTYEAVITDQDYMVLIKTYSYMYDASVQTILETFALSTSVKSIFPICAQ